MDTLTGHVHLIGWDEHDRRLEGELRARGLAFHRIAVEDPPAPTPGVTLVRESTGDGHSLPLVQALQQRGHPHPIIVVGAGLLPEQIIRAIRLGAVEVLQEPVPAERLHSALNQARVASLEDPPETPTTPWAGCPVLLGDAPCMQEVYKQLGLAAGNDLNVLLTGETGVGKEVSAHSIHRHGPRADQPFVALNCTAIPEGLLEAELFGYARGAYTHAHADRPGKIESAEGGTLLLDEIGDMSPVFQAKLLRFLEEKRFHRLGDNTPRQADVRIVAATNRDLATDVEAGRFRRDLFYRLAQFPIHIPPLRERPGDIRTLTGAFVAESNQQLGVRIQGLTPQAEAAALCHSWPGNVRELRNVIGLAAVHTRLGWIDHLPLRGDRNPAPDGAPEASALTPLIRNAVCAGQTRQWLQAVERATLCTLMEHFQGNRSRVAEEMGISRNTLSTRLKTHGI
ncbi:MAG: sigma 54-interacting transcriptional regulator [Ectothiorhodospira sp.]